MSFDFSCMVEIEVDNVYIKLNFKKKYYEIPKSRQKCTNVKQIAVYICN